MTDGRAIGNVLITGGGSGLGAAVATAVHEAGGRPIVLDVNTSGIDWPDVHEVDVADGVDVEWTIGRILAEVRQLDAVVTAAGIDRPGDFEDVSAEEWERVVAVNLFGTASVVRAAMPALLASHGRAILIASSLSLRALPAASAYCASKFGLVGFARALAQETRGRMGVTTVFPAGMDTPFFDGREAQYRPGPDAHLIDPAAVAEAIVFAMRRPQGVELRELVICPDDEPSWP